ncbi:hypothetical protein DAEQUDRAFT_738779 [Daedalea quercina L-15889]|uniref:Uncharacterized protein n=1 Tax=Daedalea quercina L-15889 TaxID=1314783 RepID=A0A165PMI7_9APHY|nr:hypothetical protein DAEQUDRAFT_738779 [Daedalea quercina L-15889]
MSSARKVALDKTALRTLVQLMFLEAEMGKGFVICCSTVSSNWTKPQQRFPGLTGFGSTVYREVKWEVQWQRHESPCEPRRPLATEDAWFIFAQESAGCGGGLSQKRAITTNSQILTAFRLDMQHMWRLGTATKDSPPQIDPTWVVPCRSGPQDRTSSDPQPYEPGTCLTALETPSHPNFICVQDEPQKGVASNSAELGGLPSRIQVGVEIDHGVKHIKRRCRRRRLRLLRTNYWHQAGIRRLAIVAPPSVTMT